MHDIYIYIYILSYICCQLGSFMLPTTYQNTKDPLNNFCRGAIDLYDRDSPLRSSESQRGRLCPNTGTCVWFVFWFCTHSFVCKNMWFSMNARVLVGNKKIIISEMDSLWLFRWFFSSSFVFKLAMFRLEIRVEAQFLTWLVGKTKGYLNQLNVRKHTEKSQESGFEVRCR